MASPPVFLHHPSSLDHDTGPHPERAERIMAINQELDARDWLGFERVLSQPADRSWVTAVHPPAYVDNVEALCRRGGAQLDLDTVVSERSFGAALHSAGGAVALVDLLLDGAAPFAFTAHRPPGHHALSARAMGFCLFNNIAIAARYAITHRSLQRVMIFDWDVHHGNGTNDIFHASDQVLFVSIHQSPLYPGTGAARDAGTGAGVGYTVNLPVPARAGDDLYRSLTDHVVVPLARAFEPQLVLVSAGYDAHIEDPLAECHVTEAGFAAMSRSVRAVCAELGVPAGCVLEGGYALRALSRSVAATMSAFSGADAGATDGAPGMAPLAREARARLSSWWPALG